MALAGLLENSLGTAALSQSKRKQVLFHWDGSSLNCDRSL